MMQYYKFQRCKFTLTSVHVHYMWQNCWFSGLCDQHRLSYGVLHIAADVFRLWWWCT